MKQSIKSNNNPVIIGGIINISVKVLFGKEVQQGDILLCSNSSNKWVIIIKEVQDEKIHFYASYNLTANVLNTADWCRLEYLKRHASANEKVKLFEALGRNGFVWDSTKLKLSQTEERCIVPCEIGIYKLSTAGKPNINIGDGLFINSGQSNTLLCINDGGFAVIKNSQSLFEYVKCRLVPCKYSDLKCGDTAFKGGQHTDPYKVKYYVKFLDKGYVYFHQDSAVRSYSGDYEWYRVVPIE